MKKDNLQPKNILMGILIVGLVLIGVSFFKQLNFSDNSQQVARGKRVEIVAGDILEQKFTAQQNGLSNLKILFGSKPLKEDNHLIFILADGKCEKQISKKVLNGKYEFNSKHLYDFSFPKIDYSQDKKYCLKIILEKEVKQGVWQKIRNKFKKEGKHKRQKIRLFEASNNNNGAENYIVKSDGKVKIEGGRQIVFRSGCKNKTIFQDFSQLNQRMSQYKSWFLKGGYLTSVVIVVTVITGWGIMELFRKK